MTDSALNCTPSTDKVHDDRDNRKQQEEMNKQPSRLKDHEAPDPDNEQNNSENKKHRLPSFFATAQVRL